MLQSVPARRSGFSLVELLVVIGVLGVLLGLFLPAVQRVRESAARAECLNNLKQIGLALHHFHDVNGQFPPLPARSDKDPHALLTWRALLLPQVEQESLWAVSRRACDLEPRPWRNPPHVGMTTVIKLFVCPSDGRLRSPLRDHQAVPAAYSSYYGVTGGYSLDGTLGMSPGIRLSTVRDGTSNTLLAGERPPPDTLESGLWYAKTRFLDHGLSVVELSAPADPCRGLFRFGPGRTDNRCDQYHFWSLHPGGANFVFADGSARYLPYSAEPIMLSLATRSGGEVVN